MAAWIDGKQLRVPNWITFPMVGTGFVYNLAAYGVDGLGIAFAGMCVGLLTLLPLYAVGGMGAGDVKLMAGLGAWLGWQVTLWAFVYTVVVGAVMAIVMLGFMFAMYPSRAANLAIFAAAAIVFAASLWLVRSQRTVDDVSYMKAMIPHHSIAVLTSRRAHISDPRVRELADEIIEAQLREIGEMEALIRDLQTNPPPKGSSDLPPSDPQAVDASIAAFFLSSDFGDEDDEDEEDFGL